MASGKFNYDDFRSFSNNFKLAYSQFDKWIHAFLLKEGMRFIRGVKPRTPVDTGDLRNHWHIDDTSGIVRQGDTLKVWFINPMYYATFVEYGHAKPYKSGAGPGSADWVEGYFMMTITLDQINRSMPARFDKELSIFLKSLKVM